MIIAKKNAAYYLSFPAIDSTTPESYKTGISPVDTAYYKDGAGAWTSLSITDTATEIGSTGIYEIDLTASEMNHDRVIIKFAVSGMADDGYQFDLQTKLVDDLQDIAATAIVSAGAITTSSGAVANVTTTATTTTNTDMRGTDSAALASVATEARLSELDPATAGKMANQVDIIQTDTTTDIPATITALNDLSSAEILTTQLTESYAADGTAPTLSQAIFLIQQMVGDFSIAGTTITTKKLDGTTTAATFTLDDATTPTSKTRAS